MELWLWNDASNLLQGPALTQAQNVRLQYQKGVALEESGQLDEAARHFIRVLQSHEEMVDAVPLPVLERAPLVPDSPGAMWWYRLREHGDLAYQYRQWTNTSAPALPANRAGANFHVLLPQCLEEAQVFALRHLARLGEIGRSHSPPRPAITLPESIPMASLWTHVVVGQRDGHLYLHTTADRVRAHPVLLAEWLQGWLEIIDLPKGGAPALWTMAEQQFAGAHPNLAAEAALFHAFACPADQRTAHLERALNFAKRTKDGKERLALLGAFLVNEMSVSMMPDLAPRAPLSEKDESLVINALISWARDAAAVDGMPGGILSYAASTLASRGRWEEWRDLLDEAVPKIRSNAASNAVLAGWRSTGSYSYQTLAFPPSFYSGYGVGPRACLQGTLDWGISEAAQRAPADLADGAKEPLVKLLCLYAAGRTADLKQEASRLATAHPDREDVLFLKASVLAMDDESGELTNALHQWATAPVSEEVSRARAPHLVGITADAKLPADEAMQSALLVAVKHLVSLGNIADGRSDSTPEALKVAGFVSQGQMLASAMASNGGSSTTQQMMARMTPAFSSSVAQQMMTRVDSIADPAEGLRLLTETLSRYAADEIAQADGFTQYGMDNGWQWLRQALYKRTTYRESIVHHLRAEADTPRLKHEEAAFIIDRLGDSSGYVNDLYRVALERDPGNAKVRLRAICQALDGASETAAKLYREAPLEDRILIGNRLCSNTGANPMLTEILASFAGSLLRDAATRNQMPEDLRWITTLTTWHAWTGNSTQSGGGIRDLLRTEAVPADAGFGSAPLPVSVDGRRNGGYYLDQQFAALCEAAMDVPAFSLPSFTSYAGLKLKQGATVESLVPKARHALEIGDLSIFPNLLQGFSRGSFQEPRDVWQPSPLALLALHASHQQDPHAAFSELASLTKNCKVLGGERLVAALEQLYTCKESDFAKAARDFNNVPYAAGLWMDYHPTVTVARIWKERRLKLDPAPLVLPEADKVMSYFSWISGSGIVLKTMAERGQHDEAKAFLVKALEACMGPRAHWQDLAVGPGLNYRDPRMVRLTTVHSLMDNISEVEPMLAFISFELAEEAGFRTRIGYGIKKLAPTWMSHENQFSGEGPIPPHAALNFLAASPWLKPGGSLWDCPLDPEGKATVLTQYALAVRMLDKTDQADIRATLQHAAAQNPNAAFLCALVEKDQQKLLDALALANESIASVPDHAVEALGYILASELSPTQKSLAEARAPQTFMALRRVDDINSARKAEAFFTAHNVEALRMNDQEFEDTMRRAATQLASTNRAKAVKLLDRACELITDKQSRVGWNASTGNNGWSACGQAVKLWCHETQSLDVVAVACDLFHQPDEFNAVSSGWWRKPSWGGAILTGWEAGGGKANPAAGLESVLRTLHEKLAIKNAPLLVLAFMDFHFKLDAWQRMEVLRAADALAAGDSEVALYAQWLILGFQVNELADAEKLLPGSPDPAMTKRVNDGFRTLVSDESANPIVRLSLAHCLLNRVNNLVDADIIWKSMDLATLTLEREWPVHGYIILDVLNGVNRQPADERYKAAAARWLPAWLNRNRFNGMSTRMGKHYNPIGAYQSAVLTLAARGMDDVGLRQVVNTLENGPELASGNLLMLIRSGRMAVAREFFMQSKDRFIRTTDNGVVPEESDWSKIEEFAKTLPRPDQPIQVQVICGGLYGEGMLEDRWADARAFQWNRRMGEQARKVMEHPFQDRQLRDRLMLEIADAPGAVAEMKQELMEKDLRELVRTASFGSGPGPVWMSLRYPMELTLNSLAESIRKTPEDAMAATGSVFPGPEPAPLDQAQLSFQTLLERVDSGRDSRPKAECMRQIEGNLFESTMLTAPALRAPLLAGFLPAWNKILRAYSGEKERFEEEGLGVATQIVLAGLSGKTAEIDAWRQDVPHYRRDALKGQFLEKRHLMVVAEQLCISETDNRRSIDDRWKLVQGFAADPWVAEYFKDSRDTISQFMSHHLLTVEETLERGKELAAMFPTEGHVAAEIATLMLVNKRDAEVPGLLKLAMEQAGDNETWNAEWSLRLVRWHQGHRQHGEAMKVWEGLKGRVKQPELQQVLDAARPAA
jgi:tetratricopeptide (TPR) repeat protein